MRSPHAIGGRQGLKRRGWGELGRILGGESRRMRRHLTGRIKIGEEGGEEGSWKKGGEGGGVSIRGEGGRLMNGGEGGGVTMRG